MIGNGEIGETRNLSKRKRNKINKRNEKEKK